MAAKMMHKLESEEMESIGLKGPYAIYLLTIARHPNGITLSRIAEISARDKADVSRAIAAMTEKGLIEKVGSDNKNYRAPITLTEKGNAAADRLKVLSNIAVECAGKDVTDADRETFYTVLEKIIVNIKKMTETGIPNNMN